MVNCCKAEVKINIRYLSYGSDNVSLHLCLLLHTLLLTDFGFLLDLIKTIISMMVSKFCSFSKRPIVYASTMNVEILLQLTVFAAGTLYFVIVQFQKRRSFPHVTRALQLWNSGLS